jgi:hypothetical protein
MTFSPAIPSDAGLYYALVTPSVGKTFYTQSFIAYIDPQSRIINTSMLVTVNANGPPAVLGFIAPPNPYVKRLLLRVVGPGLKQFGIFNFVAQPKLSVIDWAGRDGGFIGVTDSNTNPFVVSATKKCGAFPLPDHSRDVAGIFLAQNGLYTISVGSADGTSGLVLLEIYEIPY